MDIFLTGATGHIGLNLVPLLIDRDHKVTALVRDQNRSERLPDQVRTVVGDITNIDSLYSAVGSHEAIIHLAASLDGNDERIEEVNVTGTRNVAKVAEDKGIGKFVFTSTIKAHPNIPEKDLSVYEKSKIRAEKVLQDFDFNASILYPTYIWGPMDYRMSRYNYIQLTESNIALFPPLYPPGELNVVHIDTVCRSILSCASTNSNDREMVTGKNISASELYRRLSSEKEGICMVIPIPYILLNVAKPLIDKLHSKGYFPIDSEELIIERDVGKVPSKYESRSPASNQEASEPLSDTYKWYRNIGLVE